MDKSPYETFEYLPTTENEAEQFFVVQNDGTFLSVNRQIQYVTQVQDVKEVLESVEPCTVYDVSNQQFFIDVDNSAELISVSDQFIIPDGESNIFANNYLLPVPNSIEQQIQKQDAVDQHQETETQIESQVETMSQNEINSCTEITLNDEQYQTLEQKGWLLLETNEKVFVLDTLGLHDITTNDKLIQKLKVEGQTDNEHEDPEETSLSKQQDTIQFVIGDDGIKLTEEIIQGHDSVLRNVRDGESIEVLNRVTMLQDILQSQDDTVLLNYRNYEALKTRAGESAEVLNTVTLPKDIVQSQDDTVLLNYRNDEALKARAGNTFKIKTDIIFKDIAEKIVLGETADGKKLFAKIKRLDSNINSKAIEIPSKSNLKHIQKKPKSIINNKNVQEVQFSNTSLNESQFETLIRLAMQVNSDVKCSAEDVSSANSIVTQLLQVPAFKPSVLNRNLIITKDVSIQGERGTFRSGGLPSLVTGHVTALDKDRYYFVHQPGMLQRLMNNSELPNNTNVTLNSKRKQPSMIFGCSACAAVFHTENELKEHQETQCMDVEDVLTIDMDRNNKGYTIDIKGKEKSYSCNQCQSKFIKLYNCLKHLKTHFNCIDETNGDDKTLEANEEHKDGIYKCKMCSSTYFHPATLSKHIVTKHIKVTSN